MSQVSGPAPDGAEPGGDPSYLAAADILDPFERMDQIKLKNFGRVGSVRPTALLYTAGIGASVDLPHIAVMPQGLDAWERAYAQMGGPLQVFEPRLIEAVKAQLGRQVRELRRPPRQEVGPREVPKLGVPAAAFPRWLRCTGCDLLAPFEGEGGPFTFFNTIGMRPDQARFVHKQCRGRNNKGKPRDSVAVPARYLVACLNGHLDEFPYTAFVHRAHGGTWTCEKTSGVTNPATKLRMLEWRSNIGPEVRITCVTCGLTRSMRELTGTAGAERMPHCRGRHPHLGTFEACDAETKLMLLGAANQWFPATISLLVVPESKELNVADVAARLQGVSAELRAMVVSEAAVPMFKMLMLKDSLDLTDVPDPTVWEALALVAAGGEVDSGRTTPYSPIELRAPEWRTLIRPADFARHARESDFRIRDVRVPPGLTPVIGTVAAVDRLKKVNAFVGFTRVDAFERIGDARERLAPLARQKPTWVPATEDHGEGVFVRLREDVIGPWEDAVRDSKLWDAHKEAHRRNVQRRTSTSAAPIDADARLEPPRYWAVHTLAHLIIRQMALDAGYGSASLAERIYAWRGADDREPAAGFLISTTSPDSDGTLGGLVEQSAPDAVERLVARSIARASRCSSDPVCSHRVPRGQEDFLHGAACHFCTFLSETSCDNANRFLDRRFLLTLYSNQATDLGVTGLLDGLTT
ncbi:DrmB family protein [Kribbella sp. NBC_00359]|uniref:DrmB family protein n=1 Tax=Kribbella sp. NBC_00359 TaxID=2975966 RepID=UPI002E1A2F2F